MKYGGGRVDQGAIQVENQRVCQALSTLWISEVKANYGAMADFQSLHLCGTLETIP